MPSTFIDSPSTQIFFNNPILQLCLIFTQFAGPFISVGPRPDLDPDIVAALDDALDLDDPENILQDDFILKVPLL